MVQSVTPRQLVSRAPPHLAPAQALLAQAKADYDDLKKQYEDQLAVLKASFAKREKAREGTTADHSLPSR